MKLVKINCSSPFPVEFQEIQIEECGLPVFYCNDRDVGLVWDPKGYRDLMDRSNYESGFEFFIHFPDSIDPSCAFSIGAADRFFDLGYRPSRDKCPWDLEEEFPGVRLKFQSYRSDMSRSDVLKIFLLQEVLQARTKGRDGYWSSEFSKSKTRHVSLSPRDDKYEGLNDPTSLRWVRTSYRLIAKPGYSMIFTPITAIVPTGASQRYIEGPSGKKIHIFVIEKK